MPETVSPERDRAALLQCRARLADTHARLALLDLVVSPASPQLPYAPAIARAREHLEAALVDLDSARGFLEQQPGSGFLGSAPPATASPPAPR
jgi:hypothetical protein